MSNDFIEVFPEQLDAGACAALIRGFESSGKAVRGLTGGGLDATLKDSWDLCIDDYSEWRGAVNLLNTAMMGALMRYVRKYPYTAIAPIALRAKDPVSGELKLLEADAVAGLSDDLLQGMLVKIFRPGTINIQKYIADEGGYPYWHCESYPKIGDASGETLHRVLLWSIYLNEEFRGGETEFIHQRRLVQPRTGSMLMAPAAFTHTHRGNRPLGGHKYIATSWILFQRSEVIFGHPIP